MAQFSPRQARGERANPRKAAFNKSLGRRLVAGAALGYLRRDPHAFYLNWVGELNNTNNSRNMINGIVNSLEYRLVSAFGDGDCRLGGRPSSS
ncbi:MAG: hypothetical protein ACR2H6_11290 [Pyrinomonadaceae bacterium]